MSHFSYKEGELYCEGVSLKQMSETEESPFYVYSAQTIRDRVKILKDTFAELDDCLIAYAVKANNNLSLLSMMASMGLGADIISDGELFRFLKAGGDPSKVVFSGVAKSVKELSYAIENGIRMFNAESLPEMKRLNELAATRGQRLKVALRVNPNVEAGTHKKITTGKKGNKFGISVKTIKENKDFLKSLDSLNLCGLDVHIGSSILSAAPFVEAYNVIAEIMEELRNEGFDINTLDIGGGFGVPYEKENGGFDYETYKKEAVPILKRMNVSVIVEPGRYLTAESGALLMKAEYIKEEWDKKFVNVDAGMNDFMRVAMYEAHHDILAVVDGEKETYDVAGPVCESSDYFAKDREIAKVEEGDALLLMDCGAYGFSMSGNYNGRVTTAEFLVDGDSYKMIRKRQQKEDMIRLEEEFLV